MRYRDWLPISLLCTLTLMLCSPPSPASAQERAVTKLADGVYEIQHGPQSGNTTDKPAVTIIAHVETRKDMDMFGPGSEAREKRSQARLEQMRKTGKDGRGNPLGPDGVAQVNFLGRGNTPGDAVAWLPKEQIVAAGDLVVYPMPYFYDGYPSEWIQTLQSLAQLDATTIVPGHGPIMHDKAYLYLVSPEPTPASAGNSTSRPRIW